MLPLHTQCTRLIFCLFQRTQKTRTMIKRPEETGLVDKLSSLFFVGKCLLFVSCCQQLALLIINILLLADKVDRCTEDPCLQETNLFYSITLFLITFLQMYFSFSGILEKNIFEFFGFLLTTFCTMLYSILQVLARGEAHFIAMFVICVACQVAYFALTKRVNKEIGFTVYKRIGPNENLRKMFRLTQVYLTLLKFELMLWFVMITASVVYQDRRSSSIAIGTILTPFAIAICVLGRYSVIHENLKLVIIYQGVCLVAPVLSIYQIAVFSQTDDVPVELIGSAVAIALCCRILMMVLGYLTSKNFDQGLAPALQSKSARGPLRASSSVSNIAL